MCCKSASYQQFFGIPNILLIHLICLLPSTMPDTQKAHIYWMNELLRAVFKYTRFPPPPSRTSLKGLPSFLSFSSLGFAPPHEMLVCPTYTCMLGEGGESHCCQATECSGRGRGWWTGGPSARSWAYPVQVSRSELEIWGHSKAGGWKRTRQAGQVKLGVRSQSGR